MREQSRQRPVAAAGKLPPHSVHAHQYSALRTGGTVLSLQQTIGNTATTGIIHRTKASSLAGTDNAFVRRILARTQPASPSAAIHRCSCGTAIQEGEECESCRQKRLQRKNAETSPNVKGLVQRECKADGTWKEEYDGCSVPTGDVKALLKGDFSQLAGSILGGMSKLNRGTKFDKDNPTGIEGMEFALGIAPQPAKGSGPFDFDTDESRPCDRHDKCYQTCGSSQEDCDREMYRGMIDVCNDKAPNSTAKQQCLMWSQIYYTALRTKGKPAHDQRQNQVCSCGKDGEKDSAEASPELQAVIARLDKNLLHKWLVDRALFEYETAGPNEENTKRKLYQDVKTDDGPDAQMVAQELAQTMLQANGTQKVVTLKLPHGTLWDRFFPLQEMKEPLKQIVDAVVSALPSEAQQIQQVKFILVGTKQKPIEVPVEQNAAIIETLKRIWF